MLSQSHQAPLTKTVILPLRTQSCWSVAALSLSLFLLCCIQHPVLIVLGCGMMASVCQAGRQLLRLLCVFLLLVTLAHTVNTLLVYNRQSLLDLRISAKYFVNSDYYGQKNSASFPIGYPGIPLLHSGASPVA